MRRQLSANLENALKNSTPNSDVLRFSSMSRTRPLISIDACRHRHQHCRKRRHYHCYNTRNSKYTHYYLNHQNLPTFHGLQACYFSNVTERILNDESESSSIDVVTSNSQNPPHKSCLFVHDEDPTVLNYLKTLKEWYLNNHGEIGSVIQDAFDTKMIQNPNGHHLVSGTKETDNDDTSNNMNVVLDDRIRQIFTATFTCPLTNERFEAGRLPGYFNVNDQNFYSRKKIAIQAVSAVVLHGKMSETDKNTFGSDASTTSDTEQFAFRQKLQQLYMKHFKTSPTQSQCMITKQDFVGKTFGGTWWTAEFTCPITGRKYEAADLPSEVVPNSMKMKEAGQIWYRKKTDSVHASAFHAIESIQWNTASHILEKENSSADSMELEKSMNVNRELQELTRPLLLRYIKRGRCDMKISVDDDFIVTKGSDFRKDDERHNMWTASFVCPLTAERFNSGSIHTSDKVSHTEIDKLVWYTERGTAIKAASQRAYDVFKYRDTGINDPRFCKEDPSEPRTESFSLSSSMQPKKNGFNAVYDDRNYNDISNEKNSFEFDEENFVIEMIPQQLDQSSGQQRVSCKTLDAVAQAWSDSRDLPIDKEKSNNNNIEIFQNPVIERAKAIHRALEWVSRQGDRTDKLSVDDRTQFDVKNEMCNLKIANMILSSLAECHRRVPFDPQPTGIIECATAVLESMWSSHSTKPDADSYAFFLKCMEGETPSDVVAKAQDIVNSMESGLDYNGRRLPQPNRSVYSSLAELKALSGLLENSYIDSLDRNIHLCNLSSMAHNPETFDADVAAMFIDQMRTLSKENDEPYLQPDIEAYNAPLRWSGNGLCSRLYSRVIPWDSYHKIYEDGFKSDSGNDIQQSYAKKVEQWIDIMKRQAPSDSMLAPNVETYESLIQAWVRCANRKTLFRAETIAKNIIKGDCLGVEPRVQTFYPILAAWTYSGCEEGPAKVREWINILQDLVPQLAPCLRVPDLLIMAQISFQRQILKRLSDPLDMDSSCTKKYVFDSAIDCSDIIQKTISQYKDDPESDVRSDIFMLVINVWYNAAFAAISSQNLEDTWRCLRRIQNAVDQFDDLLLCFKEDDSNRARKQFLILLDSAPSVYGAQLAAQASIGNLFGKFQNVNLKEYGATVNLNSIEKMLRSLEEFHLFWGGHVDVNVNGIYKGEKDVGTKSIFPIEGLMGELFCTCWFECIDLSLDVLQTGAEEFSIEESDLIRLTMSIARIASSATPDTLNQLSKDRILDKVVMILKKYSEHNEDSKAVISTVIQAMQNHPVWPRSNGKTLHPADRNQNNIDHDCPGERVKS